MINNNSFIDKDGNNGNEINISHQSNKGAFKDDNSGIIKNATSKRLLRDSTANVKNVSFNIVNNNNTMNHINVKNNNPLIIINGVRDVNSSNRNNTKTNKLKLNLWGKVNEKKEKNNNNNNNNNNALIDNNVKKKLYK